MRISPSALPVKTLRIVVILPSVSRLKTARMIVRLAQRFFAVGCLIVRHYHSRHLSVLLRIRSLSLQMAKRSMSSGGHDSSKEGPASTHG
jgi:hypothetical protein